MYRKKKVGKEIEPSRILKLKECCDLLIAAGYFRARMDLSPFDKVVGGMVWSITASGVDVGVDILFQENSTIGERIKLSENLVKALVYMKSPLPLQSHQIQGLDYDNLLPVLQWLIKKVIETRRLTGDLVRALSVSQFDRDYEFPDQRVPDDAMSFIRNIGDRYKSTRKYKKMEGANLDLAQRTEATLLEYGEKLYGAIVYDEEKQDRKKELAEQRNRGAAAAQKLEAQKEEELEAVRQAQYEADQKLEALKQQLSSEGAAVQVSGSSVGNILSQQADEIRKAAEGYDEEMRRQAAEEEDPKVVQQRAELQAFERKVEAGKKKIRAEEAEIEKRREDYETLEQKVQTLRAQVAKKEKYKARLVVETAKLDAVEEAAENKGALTALKNLVYLNESLKAQEAEFKTACTDQRAKLMAMMKALEDGESDAETKRMLEIERIFEADNEKLSKLRIVLAKKNQEIAKVTRAIDEIPTRAELLQYERRFVELYNLVQDKLVETRKYYELYNTLNANYQFMSSEDQLLNSITEQFPVAIKGGNKAKESFLKSMGGIVEGVGQNGEQVEKELQQESTMRDHLNQKHSKLLENQRKYFKAVKEFQEECFKNEKLTDLMERLSAH